MAIPINLLKIRSGYLHNSPSILLTLLSIIVVINLEHLLLNIFKMKECIPKVEFVAFAIQCVSSFLILLLIWFDYVWAILFYRWKIGFLDSFLLFLIIIPQLLSIQYLNKYNLWPIGACITSFIGILSYKNTKNNIKKLNVTKYNPDIIKSINILIIRNQNLCIIMMIIVFCISILLIFLFKIYNLNKNIIPTFFLIATILKLFLSSRFVNIFLYANSIKDMEFINLFKFTKIKNKLTESKS